MNRVAVNSDGNKIIPMLDLTTIQKDIEEELNTAVLDVIRSAKYINQSPISEFEEKLKNYLNKSNAIGVGSCTDALYIALKAYGISSGSEVITVANSFYATTEAILRCGAIPVFVDIDPDTHLMDINKVIEKLSCKTQAILPVHLYGNVVDINKLKEIITSYGRNDLVIIEDCAHAFGSQLNGIYTPIGETGAFSFNPGKNCGALSDAGALVTTNSEVARKAILYRDHGRENKHEHVEIGLNSRLNMINDAVLSLKINYIEEWNEKRRENAKYYHSQLSKIPGIKFVSCNDGVLNSYHQFVIEVEERDSLRNYLKSKGIESGIHYPTLITYQPVIEDLGFSEQLPFSEEKVRKIISIPCHHKLTVEDLNFITEKLSEFYKECR